MPVATKNKSLSAKLAEFDAKTPKDFDPEDDDFVNSEEDESDVSDDGEDGREHYYEVGESKLRKPATVPLGPAYSGSKISRKALEDFNDSDDSLLDGEEEDDDDEEGNEEEDEEDEEDEDDEDDEDDDEDNDDEDEADVVKKNYEQKFKVKQDIIEREELKMLNKQDAQRTASANRSNSATGDIEKGIAIKKQRATFDKLLGIRIKLQKALICTNSLTVNPEGESIDSSAIQNVEAVALRLLTTLDGIRSSLGQIFPGEKRKFRSMSSDDPLSEIWNTLKSHEKVVKKQRYNSLDTWSARTQTLQKSTGQFRFREKSKGDDSLSSILEGQFSDIDRLVAKTMVPRSCAPLQAKDQLSIQDQDGSKSLPIYDDADFYGTLLQSLIAQRASTDTEVPIFIQPWQIAKDAKTKRNVDTKASKGRRLKFNVHEKLQDLMPREDRTKWSERQIDELFASLLGRKVKFEDDQSDQSDQEAPNQVQEMERLRLFA